MKALLIDGSPAEQSRVSVLLNTVRIRLENRCEMRLVQLQTLQLPANDPAYHDCPQDHPESRVRDWAATIRDSDIIVLGTPLYHGSYSGLLKLALDHLADDAFAGKVIGTVSNASNAGGSFQAAQALVPVARALKGDVANCIVGTCKDDYGVHDDTFQILDSSVLKRLDMFTDELLAKAGRQ